MTARPRNHQEICVTFDLWETLILDTPENDGSRRILRCKGLQRILAAHRVDLSLEALLSAYDESAQWLQSVWSRNRETPTIEQIHYIIRNATESTTDLPEDSLVQRQLLDAYSQPLLEVPPVLRDEALPTLEELRSKVGKIGLISNTGRSPGESIRELLELLGVLRFFDATIFSNEVGWRKPEKQIFEAAAEKLGVRLEDVVHVGDHPEADVWGAKNAGMRAVLLEYEVPEGFREQPASLLALSRLSEIPSDRVVEPDCRIRSLDEAVDFVETLD